MESVPFQYVSLPYVPPTPGVALVPPTAVTLGESAGTATVFGLPSRHVLPLSPLPVSTLIPEAAACWSTESIASASLWLT